MNDLLGDFRIVGVNINIVYDLWLGCLRSGKEGKDTDDSKEERVSGVEQQQPME